MSLNVNLKQGAKEYRQKLKLGLVSQPNRLDPIEKSRQNPNSLRFAINAKCFDCSGFERPEVTNCEMTDCFLYRHRPWQNKASA